MRPSDRLERLPAYPVGELARVKQELLASGRDVIDLSAGDPDFPPPAIAVEALTEALGDPAMSRYSFQVGLRAFREAVVRYMARRFGVDLDPATEILPLIGSKEGLVHLPQAVVNPGGVCVLPDPGYPAYIGGATLSEAQVVFAPLRADHDFLAPLDRMPAVRSERGGLVYMNYPNNPTTAVAPRDYLEQAVAFCREHGMVIAYDNPYAEVTFDGYRAPSILEIDGARDVTVEFHSLSKTFSMTGWRLGWAAGGKELITALSGLKSYVDAGPFLAVQYAGARVLDHAEELAEPLRSRLAARRDVAVTAFREAGFAVSSPRATMYVWIPLPDGVDTARFAWAVLEEEGVMVMPGTAFGDGGDGFFRIALTVGEDRVLEAAERVGRVLSRQEEIGAGA